MYAIILACVFHSLRAVMRWRMSFLRGWDSLGRTRWHFWGLQRARCVLKRRKDTHRQKKARRMENLKRQAVVLKNKVGRCRQSRHRNKREEYKVIAPASGQRRRRLLKEDLHGKVKTRKEGGAPGECVPLPGFLNYFFTHLINCMFGFLVVWSTNAALSGCLVRGQLV